MGSRLNLNQLPEIIEAASILFSVGDGVNVITAGAKQWARIPYGLTVTGWQLTGDVTGSIVIDIWQDTYANFPPTVADSITASAKPTITGANKATSTTLTGWTTALTGGNYLRINVDSVSSFKYVQLIILCTRS